MINGCHTCFGNVEFKRFYFKLFTTLRFRERKKKPVMTVTEANNKTVKFGYRRLSRSLNLFTGLKAERSDGVPLRLRRRIMSSLQLFAMIFWDVLPSSTLGKFPSWNSMNLARWITWLYSPLTLFTTLPRKFSAYFSEFCFPHSLSPSFSPTTPSETRPRARQFFVPNTI